MSKQTKSIVIVGGGTAGWITAGRIAAEHNNNPDIRVTLIESPSIKTIGVGEGTWPTMRNTLKKMGISETEFMRQCDATFKQGAKFAKWHTGEENDFYYHPLMLTQCFQKQDLSSHWLRGEANPVQQNLSFSEAVCFQESICEQGLAPKLITTPEYASIANYAYHLDAGKFSEFLKRHCTENLSVRHISADVTAVNLTESDDIDSVTTDAYGDVYGELFVDCSGFRSLLLGDALGVPFVDRSDVLFIDQAIAVQVPYQNSDDAIASHTISTGQDAGWIWDIGLKERRGIGYVYSSRYCSEQQAEQTLREYVGPVYQELTKKKIPITSGHRDVFWKNNCVAVGLSAGFLEPLEASALVLVELSAEMIAEQLPANRHLMTIMAKRFNDTFLYRWDRIVDFLKLHYILTERTEPFWRDNCEPNSIPSSLKELMQLWQFRPPGNHDFTSNNEVFPAASYQYVLYGMGFKTEQHWGELSAQKSQFAFEQFKKNEQMKKQVIRQMPKNRELIEKIHQYGFSTI
jgi:flavin-dependent dehydrogenase